MRMVFGVAAMALMAAPPAFAQPQYAAPPRGSYQRQCTDIRMNGQFLSATCRGARGGGQSSINVLSCAGDIGVDDSGALSCAGPGAAAPSPPPQPRYAPPSAYAPGGRPGYDSGPRYGDRSRRYRSDVVTLFAGRGSRGMSVRVEGDMPNLSATGLNDRVRSIELSPGSGPWIVCADANYRGRCVTIDRSIDDTRDIGMRDAVSSLRPAR
jgi:hypothetical protein